MNSQIALSCAYETDSSEDGDDGYMAGGLLAPQSSFTAMRNLVSGQIGAVYLFGVGSVTAVFTGGVQFTWETDSVVDELSLGFMCTSTLSCRTG